MHVIGQALEIPFKVSSAAGFFVNCVHIVICCMTHECVDIFEFLDGHECTLQVEVLDEES